MACTMWLPRACHANQSSAKGFPDQQDHLDYLRLASVCCSKLPVKLSASALTGVKHDALKAQRLWDPDHSFFNHSVWSNKNGDVLIH
ncbi:hypothetical protein PENSUB_524 [Penicillium subrubescens]|uniref:Uncharacterized protein n=1 Tax=Penicillium subrubescens TaxID=1316194 RepID=A0A1Q5UMV5_9EURO|nr:hypothetical protein PENSUB_524 [Penicillium subrubescens]